jgi:hypothetical protein
VLDCQIFPSFPTFNLAMRSSRLSLLLLSLACLLVPCSALMPPPAFEHKAPRNVKGTNCEACQAVIKQALRKMGGSTTSKPDLSTQKLRRAREQKVSALSSDSPPHYARAGVQRRQLAGRQLGSRVPPHTACLLVVLIPFLFSPLH